MEPGEINYEYHLSDDTTHDFFFCRKSLKIFSSLLNYLPYLLSYPTCSRASRAFVPHVSRALRTSYPTCLVPHVPRALRASCLKCLVSYVLVSYVLSYLTCLTCQYLGSSIRIPKHFKHSKHFLKL